VVLGVRGILYVELRARGANTDVHSGNRGGVVLNPAWTLVDLLHSLRTPDGRVAIEGFYDDVRPIGPLERDALDHLPVDLDAFLRGYELPALPPPPEWSFFERLLLQPTLNISGFSSGYAGAGMKTIIPATASVKLDMRLVADQHPDHVFACLVKHVQSRAPDVEVVRIGSMEPSRTALDHPFVAAVAEAVAAAHEGQPPLIVPALGGSLPDYVFTRILGLPSLLVPYANPDQRNHAPNENFTIERFGRGIKTFAAVLDRLASL
jgi:acetylornithine deacetylase/succinyl-diaminopimelate desuccinylase-like protein